MIDVVEEKSDGMSVKAEDKEFIANFYKYAFVGMTLEWIKNGMKTDPEQIINQLSLLIHGDVSRALNSYRIDQSTSNRAK